MTTMKQAVGKPAQKKPGRQTLYTPEIADEICERIANGETLRAICRSPGMPVWRTVYDWLEAHESFATAYARARATGFDAIAQEALLIADTPVEGVEYTTKADGGMEEKRGDMLGHRKLQIETRLKLLAKWDPKRYGEKLALGGADDLPPIKTLSDDALAARVAALAKKVAGGSDAG